jgi:indolepyruvate ferredoxin oxidoreductase
VLRGQRCATVIQEVQLTDRYTIERGTVYLTGIQAIVRLPLDQMRRDRRAGLKTAGYISGYEGSPLGGYDMALRRAGSLLKELGIHFQPGVNEDLAATAIFGSQIQHVVTGDKWDGIVGIWYGKGPGLDRSADILRHAGIAGAARSGAALVLAGDDHNAKSSTVPHQSDFTLMNYCIPTLFPGNTQEVLDYGLAGIALSRYSGAWAGLKMVTNICDGGGTVAVDPDRPGFVSPPGYEKRNDHRLLTPYSLPMEYEMNRRRLDAAKVWTRANKLNRWHGAKAGARTGIVSAGKAYYDLMQSLADCGIDAAELERRGIRIAKYAVTFPVEPVFTAEFADGLETIIVVEEKRSFLEFQLRDALYNLAVRPRVIGKEDAEGRPWFPAHGELDPEMITAALGFGTPATPIGPKPTLPGIQRVPNFCSGCPHNRSTILLPGQIAGGGTGCHGMAIELHDAGRGFEWITQMGGEGAPWNGIAPFSDRKHMFQNLGDGTFLHSGMLSVQASVASRVNITYKLLFNRAVAMTGGQASPNAMDPPAITRMLEAMGVRKVFVLSENEYPEDADWAEIADVRNRLELTAVLREAEKLEGVSVILYDQQCAAEKRRLRSRGKLAEPVKRLVINERVCEGCGDCVKQSNCMSLQPVETAFGQKMRIHQGSCNKDYTCALGDCPSFVTVKLKAGAARSASSASPLLDGGQPEDRPTPSFDQVYRIISPGIGGTGVITINALLATAASIDGLSVITLDQTGLAQKGGGVVSHLVLTHQPEELAARINTGNADLILGFDLLGTVSPENMKCANPERTVAVLNTDVTPTSQAIRQGRSCEENPLLAAIDAVTVHNIRVNASQIAEDLFGSHLFVNMFLTGVAWQAECIPISSEAIEQAIRLNGVDVDRNLAAFVAGRKYMWGGLQPARSAEPAVNHYEELVAYQGRAWADKWRAFVERVAARRPELADTVGANLFKLMAYKDEYEVARLLTDPAFERRTREMWDGVESISYNLHPPLLRSLGLKRKIQLGPWFRLPLKLLSSAKVLRGTPFDIFGYSKHRREERALIGWYRDLVDQVLNGHAAPELLKLPETIRGYEMIKAAAIEKARTRVSTYSPVPMGQPVVKD